MIKSFHIYNYILIIIFHISSVKYANNNAHFLAHNKGYYNDYSYYHDTMDYDDSGDDNGYGNGYDHGNDIDYGNGYDNDDTGEFNNMA